MFYRWPMNHALTQSRGARRFWWRPEALLHKSGDGRTVSLPLPLPLPLPLTLTLTLTDLCCAPRKRRSDCGEAVQDGCPDLKLGDLAVEVA